MQNCFNRMCWHNLVFQLVFCWLYVIVGCGQLCCGACVQDRSFVSPDLIKASISADHRFLSSWSCVSACVNTIVNVCSADHLLQVFVCLPSSDWGVSVFQLIATFSWVYVSTVQYFAAEDQVYQITCLFLYEVLCMKSAKARSLLYIRNCHCSRQNRRSIRV